MHNIKCLGGLSPTRPLHRVDPHLSPALHPNSNICTNTRPHIVSPLSVSPSRIQLGTTGGVPSMLGSSSEFETTNSILPCTTGTIGVPCNLPDNVFPTPDHDLMLNGVEVCDVTNKTVTDAFFPVPARICVLTAQLLRCKTLMLSLLLVLICPTTV